MCFLLVKECHERHYTITVLTPGTDLCTRMKIIAIYNDLPLVFLVSSSTLRAMSTQKFLSNE